MKALLGAFYQEKALVGAFSVFEKTDCETDGAVHYTALIKICMYTDDDLYRSEGVTLHMGNGHGRTAETPSGAAYVYIRKRA